ncbi:hypothetical protein G6F24_017529 [Rhizopus arrhizus]|nr:hypothetical protein G6F24_017529 [Rhizopus arrhizus]
MVRAPGPRQPLESGACAVPGDDADGSGAGQRRDVSGALQCAHVPVRYALHIARHVAAGAGGGIGLRARLRPGPPGTCRRQQPARPGRCQHGGQAGCAG